MGLEIKKSFGFSSDECFVFPSGKKSKDEEILIIYLSRTGNTKVVSEIIKEKIGGTLVSIELENHKYNSDFEMAYSQVEDENDQNFLPLVKEIHGIEKYKFIFIGFPTWATKLPPPVRSFLKKYDLSGKTIFPFNTHIGLGSGSSFQTIKEMCPNSKVLEGYSTRGGEEKNGISFVMEGRKKKQTYIEIDEWIDSIGLSDYKLV